ncbi:stage V sporulation protein AA [Weizmannia acidilactici]|uniref:Stage V sporulation protein AA n=1 Tax=Weizmannia acidilactici TaxID=2607726 RepID=A0A5J4JDC7_9BACI|nr:stage V sporulation protein AA [Weizmannia acidilactici]GER66076.1 stage V sporulation protein AA [Weizmannia acidilactici]GER69289.1 stage V sporulation protein AA [Weizmannia acidilactici]GER72385.1 stage V sporulation protein AA [Weizmannia acidilactici]
MDETVYLRLRHRIRVNPGSSVLLSHIAQIIAPGHLEEILPRIPIHQITEEDRDTVVVDMMQIISCIRHYAPSAAISQIGPSEAIIEVAIKKRNLPVLFFILIWILLFLGSALAIINFHEDVGMQAAQEKIYYLITGIHDDTPLVFQIPYSLGLGAGMVIFFNHVFKKRFNEEPSPLEVEIFNYQQDIDQYILLNENKESIKHFDHR